MQTSLRVLFVTHNAPRYVGDASGSFVLRLAVALQEKGARVDIIAPGAVGLASREAIEGVSIARVCYAPEAKMTLAYGGDMAERVSASWHGKRALLQLLLATRRATSKAIGNAMLDGAPYHIVHAHWWFPSGLAIWQLRARRVNRIPLVITMHGSDVRLAQRHRSAHPIMRTVLRQASVVTAVSNWLAEGIRQVVTDARVPVSPMPVDTRLFHQEDLPGVSHMGVPRNGVLFVGRLNAQKGIADLLDAMAEPILAGVPLHVVGDGPDREAMRARAEARGLTERVTWHGSLPQPALIPLYRRASVVAIPSRGEGLGLVAVEAQLSGTPVVAYADGGLPDVVQPNEGGTLVATGDVPALAERLAGIVYDPVLAQRLGQKAEAAMLAQFSPAAAADRYLTHYGNARAMTTRR